MDHDIKFVTEKENFDNRLDELKKWSDDHFDYDPENIEDEHVQVIKNAIKLLDEIENSIKEYSM